MTYNYVKCIHHARTLITMAQNCKPGMRPVASSTLYNAHMYMAEAYCMIGKFPEAMESLEEAEGVCADHQEADG